MNKLRSLVSVVTLAALLSGCGGGGDGGSASPTPTATVPIATPAPTGGACSLRERQLWAAAQIREWYLFPETLPAGLDPAGFATVNDYVDALTATARGQRRDRFFTHVASIAEETAYYTSGQTAGFGIRLTYTPTELIVTEAYEGAPALGAGIDRGARIIGIGATEASVQSVASLYATGGDQAVADALGPATPGTSRALRILRGTQTSVVTIAKADYALLPVSPRYGVRILDTGGRRVGYVNLRTFIDTAEPALRQAFQQFRDAGIDHVVLDFRYNGGGLVRTAELLGDLMGRNRFTSDVFSYTSFRPEKAAENDVRAFQPEPQSIAPARLAVIGFGGTASASELVTNAFIPYLGDNLALVGGNTYGKPVGQIARDRAACDDRLRVVAFATQNRDRQGDYYDGLRTVAPNFCAATDDTVRPLGDASEASLAAAVRFLNGERCGRAAAMEAREQSLVTRAEPLLVDRPNVAQRDVPGLF